MNLDFYFQNSNFAVALCSVKHLHTVSVAGSLHKIACSCFCIGTSAVHALPLAIWTRRNGRCQVVMLAHSPVAIEVCLRLNVLIWIVTFKF
mmetsp:Transcript_101583/g.176324  ORF Transcript_101583/g.176324 Transcript_101583/m.176324 type:complete len:91 (+) Transcript_101583:98-370(+)